MLQQPLYHFEFQLNKNTPFFPLRSFPRSFLQKYSIQHPINWVISYIFKYLIISIADFYILFVLDVVHFTQNAKR